MSCLMLSSHLYLGLPCDLSVRGIPFKYLLNWSDIWHSCRPVTGLLYRIHHLQLTNYSHVSFTPLLLLCLVLESYSFILFRPCPIWHFRRLILFLCLIFYPWLRFLFPCLTPRLLCSSLSLPYVTWLTLDLLRVTNSFYFSVLVAPLTLVFPYSNFPVSHLPPYSTSPWLTVLSSFLTSLSAFLILISRYLSLRRAGLLSSRSQKWTVAVWIELSWLNSRFIIACRFLRLDTFFVRPVSTSVTVTSL